MKIEKLTEEDISGGGLYQLLAPKAGKLETWCRHNLLIAVKAFTPNPTLSLVDTYQSGSAGTSSGVYSFEEVKGRLIYLFDLNNARDVSKREWQDYSKKDRVYIPIGGQAERWLIDTRAKKSKACTISMLEEVIAHLKSTIEFDLRKLNAKKKALSGLIEDTKE
jgi:hypothetical protein